MEGRVGGVLICSDHQLDTADNIMCPSPEHLVIVDAYENRYEILDMNPLDLRSLKSLHTVL